MFALLIALAGVGVESAAKAPSTMEQVGVIIGGAVLTIIGGYGAAKAKGAESKTNDQTKLITETLMVVGAIKGDLGKVVDATKDLPAKVAVIDSEVSGLKESIRKQGERIGAVEQKLKIEQTH